MIYSVSLHRKPGKKVQTFWFTQKDNAVDFYKSIKDNPKALDARFVCVPNCDKNAYDDTLTEPSPVMIDCWEKAKV